MVEDTQAPQEAADTRRRLQAAALDHGRAGLSVRGPENTAVRVDCHAEQELVHHDRRQVVDPLVRGQVDEVRKRQYILGEGAVGVPFAHATCAAFAEPPKRPAIAVLAVPAAGLAAVRENPVGIELAGQDLGHVEEDLPTLGPERHAVAARLIHPVPEAEYAALQRFPEHGREGWVRAVAVQDS